MCFCVINSTFFYAVHTSFDGIVMLIFLALKAKKKHFVKHTSSSLVYKLFSTYNFGLTKRKYFQLSTHSKSPVTILSSLSLSLCLYLLFFFPLYSFSFSSSLIKNYHPEKRKKLIPLPVFWWINYIVREQQKRAQDNDYIIWIEFGAFWKESHLDFFLLTSLVLRKMRD